jgi:hypothetical protein
MDGEVEQWCPWTSRPSLWCYVGVPNVEASGNVWLTKEHDAFVTPRL